MPTKKPAASSPKSEAIAALYDGAASQRIPIEIIEGSERIESAHNVGPVSDTAFIGFVDAVDTDKFTDEESMTAEVTRASRELWKKVSKSVENIETAESDDYLDLIADDEVEQIITALLTVNVFIPNAATAAVRNLDPKSTVKVLTWAFFNGSVLKQTHELVRKTTEHKKKYDAIFAAKDEGPILTSGRQARAKGSLYDEICTKSEGFKGSVPLRFKCRVIDHHFRPVIDPKK